VGAEAAGVESIEAAVGGAVVVVMKEVEAQES
jgi:hypothetical protein